MQRPPSSPLHDDWQPGAAGQQRCLAGFLNVVDLDGRDLVQHGAAIERLRNGELQAILVHDAIAGHLLAETVARLEQHQPPFLQTWFPPAFHAWFYGRNLNLVDDGLDRYFGEAARFNQQLEALLPEHLSLQDRIAGLLSALDAGRPFIAAPGPTPGDQYMFTTLRAHLEQGYIPAHFDNEMQLRPGYRHLATLVTPHILSFVLAFSQAHEGGALEVFDLRCEPGDARLLNDDSAPKPDLHALSSVRFHLPPGSMIVLDSGRYLHRLTRVVGARKRWTACSFMARSRSGDVNCCWG
jgi:hypothetical protein